MSDKKQVSTDSLLKRVKELGASNRTECFVLFVHCLLQEEGYACTHVHDSPISPTAPSLPDSWNAVSGCYSFQYEKDDQAYYFRALPFDDNVVTHFNVKGSSSSDQFQRNLSQIFSSDEVDDILGKVDAWKKIQSEFMQFIRKEDKSKEDKDKPKDDRRANQPEGFRPPYPDTDYDSPLRIPGSGRPHARVPPQFDPFEGAIGGGFPGGMHVGPDHPMFGDDPLRMNQPRRPNFPDRPPNARFDPYGPFPGANGGPNPDHMRFPPDSHHFM